LVCYSVSFLFLQVQQAANKVLVEMWAHYIQAEELVLWSVVVVVGVVEFGWAEQVLHMPEDLPALHKQAMLLLKLHQNI